ncbi:uncharacterized protein EKO05_0010138 [Ascochyta rabiei]|uniref:Uncharacterized protein n=1 Tax=Didymella rabiei TaxID=5454 RepID=A0A163MFH4_DIDRA|nr:uncharacterized protein EKO05_0010138 [Ascochyta rabiei]KZM28669.1 hypothetical protein ST47_g197 [Ascochyta rabiei]UPX19888.1 hypothetical protein EKO05_0010138 [Ascochyta rabiei]
MILSYSPRPVPDSVPTAHLPCYPSSKNSPATSGVTNLQEKKQKEKERNPQRANGRKKRNGGDVTRTMKTSRSKQVDRVKKLVSTPPQTTPATVHLHAEPRAVIPADLKAMGESKSIAKDDCKSTAAPQQADPFNPCATLGLPPSAPLVTIKIAAHLMALRYHSDKQNGKTAADKERANTRMWEMKRARGVLLNVWKAAWDEMGKEMGDEEAE